MHIYKATLTVYVAANGETEAKLAADRNEEDFSNWEVKRVLDYDDVEPEDWLGYIPWIENLTVDAEVDCRTVEELLDAGY